MRQVYFFVYIVKPKIVLNYVGLENTLTDIEYRYTVFYNDNL